MHPFCLLFFNNEGKDAQKVYDDYSEFCDDKSDELGFEIKTGKADVAELTATIEAEISATNYKRIQK